MSGSFLVTPLHFPAYPLYVHLGKLFTLLPVGSIATRTSLMNIASGAATAALLVLAFKRLLGAESFVQRSVPMLLISALLLSPTFREESTIAENTMPFIALLAWSLVSPPRLDSRSAIARSLLPSFLFLSFHLLFLMAGTAVALLVGLASRSTVPRATRVTAIAVFALLAGSTYLFVPLRTSRPVRLTEVGASDFAEARETLRFGMRHRGAPRRRSDNPGWLARLTGNLRTSPEARTWVKFMESLRLSEPEHASYSPSVSGDTETRPVGSFWRRQVAREFALVLVPIWIIGAFWIARKFPLSAYLSAFVFLGVMSTTITQSGQEIRGQSLPALVYVAYWAGVAFVWLLRTGERTAKGFAKRFYLMSAWALAITAGIVTARNALSVAAFAARDSDPVSSEIAFTPTDFGEDMLSSIEPNALAMVSYPRTATMFYYYQFVENRRPDMDMVVEPVLISDYYLRDRLRSMGLDVEPEQGPGQRFAVYMGDVHRTRVRRILTIVSPQRPTYRDAPFYEIRFVPPPSFSLSSEALAGADLERLSIDPWGPIKLLIRSMDETKLAEAFTATNPEPEIPMTRCGWMYAMDSPGRPCPSHDPDFRGSPDSGTNEVQAIYVFRQAVFYLGRGDVALAHRTFQELDRLNPEGPL